MKDSIKRLKVMGVIFMAVSILGASACGSKQNDAEAQAKNMLDEKYNESFLIKEYLGKQPTDNYYTVSAYSEKYPTLLFEAEVGSDGSYISDEYVSRRVCAKIENQVAENISGISGSFFIKAGASNKTIDSSNADMSVEEFVEQKTGVRFAIYFVYSPENTDLENFYDSLAQAFHGMDCLDGNLCFYITNNVTVKQVTDYLAINAKVDSGFDKLLNKATCITLPIENGSLTTTKEEYIIMVGDIQ